MATGYEAGMYRDIEQLAKSQKELLGLIKKRDEAIERLTAAVESIASSLEKIANPPLCGMEVFDNSDARYHLCALPYGHGGDCR